MLIQKDSQPYLIVSLNTNSILGIAFLLQEEVKDLRLQLSTLNLAIILVSGEVFSSKDSVLYFYNKSVSEGLKMPENDKINEEVPGEEDIDLYNDEFIQLN